MQSDQHAPERVSNLELFFDLVYVFTITQVADVVVHTPSSAGIAHAALELWILSWMYGGYAWLTNAAGPDTPKRRVLLLAGMAAFFICALAVPHAFDEDGIVFGIGYLLINLVHLTGLLLDPGRTPLKAVLRLAPFNLASAGLVLAAGWFTGRTDWVLWTGALAIQLATPFLSRTEQGFVINARHFAERHGLVILIVLGESLVSVGLAAQGHHVDLPLALGALAGLLAATTMWWAYFVGEDTRAAQRFEAGDRRRRARHALNGYGFAHMVMIYGVIAIAAATKLSLHELTAPMPAFESWLMASGAALYLAGSAAFRAVIGFDSPLPRILGAVACLAAVPAGLFFSAAGELAAIAVLIAVTLALGSAPIFFRQPPGPDGGPRADPHPRTPTAEGPSTGAARDEARSA
jgi:low temperature requirement protein LtrA